MVWPTQAASLDPSLQTVPLFTAPTALHLMATPPGCLLFLPQNSLEPTPASLQHARLAALVKDDR